MLVGFFEMYLTSLLVNFRSPLWKIYLLSITLIRSVLLNCLMIRFLDVY